MYPKKGQVTIFITVSIVLVAGIVLYFLLRGPAIENGNDDVSDVEGPEIGPLTNSIEICLKNETLNGFKLVFRRGGYYERPASKELSLYGRDYTIHNDASELRSDIIEREAENYLEDKFGNCINSIPGEDLEKLSYSNFTSNVGLKDDRTNSIIKGDFTYSSQESTSRIKEFSTDISADLDGILSLSKEIVKEVHSRNGSKVCFSCINDLYPEEKFSVNSESYRIPGRDGHFVFFSINSSKKSLKERNINLEFVIKK